MRSNDEHDAMARELHTHGLDAAQAARHARAFVAAKATAVAVLGARHGASTRDMLQALVVSRNLNAQVHALVARMEVSPAYVGHIHSGLPF